MEKCKHESIVYKNAQGDGQDTFRRCSACACCTRVRFPERCTCFRECIPYRHWLKCIWREVTAPLRRPKPHMADAAKGGGAA